jgi:hypothetical protein
MNYSDDEPSARNNLIGVGYDAADANWQIMHKTGSGAVTKVDLGSNFAVPTTDRSKMYELALFAAPGGDRVFYEFTDLITGAVATGEITTNLPAATTMLKYVTAVSVGGVSSVVGLAMVSMYIETDY